MSFFDRNKVNTADFLFEKKIEALDLSDLYPNIEVKVWVNPPMGLFEDVVNNSPKDVYRALCELVDSWNIPDGKGGVIPIETESFRGKIPVDLTSAILDGIAAKVTGPKVKRATR